MVDPRSIAQAHELERIKREEDRNIIKTGKVLINSSPWTMESQLRENVIKDIEHDKELEQIDTDEYIEELHTYNNQLNDKLETIKENHDNNVKIQKPIQELIDNREKIEKN